MTTTPDWFDPLVDWLFDEGRLIPDPEAILVALGERLIDGGSRVDRLRMSFWTLHPSVMGLSLFWTPNEGTGTVLPPHGVRERPSYIGSPAEAVTVTGKPFHRCLSEIEEGVDHNVLFELRDQGVTEYLMIPMQIASDYPAMIAFSTKHPDGFADGETDAFIRFCRFFAPVVETQSVRHMMGNLLDTYLGPRTGRKVLSGSVKRGDGGRIEATILFADLRDFTRLTATLAPEEMLDLLNVYFEVIHDACAAHGGEILRFIGDAMLVVFPVLDECSGSDSAAQAAVAAAQDAVRMMVEANADRTDKIGFGIGINSGQVDYGNVGAPARLDFTVMGTAVNLTQRIESLTKRVGEPVLMSRAVADAAGIAAVPKGSYAVKGVDHPVEVFGLPEEIR